MVFVPYVVHYISDRNLLGIPPTDFYAVDFRINARFCVAWCWSRALIGSWLRQSKMSFK